MSAPNNTPARDPAGANAPNAPTLNQLLLVAEHERRGLRSVSPTLPAHMLPCKTAELLEKIGQLESDVNQLKLEGAMRLNDRVIRTALANIEKLMKIHDERIARQEKCLAYMLHKMRNELLEPEAAKKIEEHFRKYLIQQQKINRASAGAIDVD